MTLTNSQKLLLYAFAALIAVGLPSIVFGRMALATPLILAFLTIPFLHGRQDFVLLLSEAFTETTAKLILLTSALWLVGLFASSDWDRSLGTEVRVLVFLLIAAVFWSVLRSRPEAFDVCIRTFVVWSVLCGLVGVVGLIETSDIIATMRGYPGMGIPAIRLLKESASSAALLIPVLVWIGFRLRGRWAGLSGLAVIELLIVVQMTESRSAVAGILAAALAVGVIVAISFRDPRIRLTSVIAILVGGGAVVAWLFVTRSWTAEFFSDPAGVIPVWLIDAQRQAIWAFAWNAGAEYRWFGVGINVVDKLPGADEWNTATTVRNIPLHPHNWLVEVIVETGLIGAAAMIATILYKSAKIVSACLRTKAPALFAATGVWAAYWGSGLFNFSYWSSWWQVTFFTLTAICLAGREDMAKRPDRES